MRCRGLKAIDTKNFRVLLFYRKHVSMDHLGDILFVATYESTASN